MGIRQIKDNGLNLEGKQPHAVWKIDIFNNTLLIERYGSWCHWDNIKIKKDGKEIYRITLDHYGEERTEFFFNKLCRKYSRDQFSFIEYITIIARRERFPKPQEYIKSGLDAKIENQYRKYLQKILNY